MGEYYRVRLHHKKRRINRGLVSYQSCALKLDATLLRKMGLTAERMVSGDVLFFAQLLLPIYDPIKSAKDRNMYSVCVKQWSEDYGLKFNLTKA